jgi:K+-transporting ATPase ATPase B chain
VPFTAQTRMSGVDLPGARMIRKGAADAIAAAHHSSWAADRCRCDVRTSAVDADRQRAARRRSVVADGAAVLGVLALTRRGQARHQASASASCAGIGITTVMITGDNPLTAAAIAAAAGVDDFLAEATPEAKLAKIRAYQARGHLVAMTGDGTNDAPALAQADVAVAMNSGTQAAKEAANMVDLDSDPTKLIEIVSASASSSWRPAAP